MRHDCIDDFLFHESVSPAASWWRCRSTGCGRSEASEVLKRSRRRGARRGRRHAARRELLDQYLELDDGEKAILAGVVEGRPNKQIAGDISCCERTVKDRRSRMMRKFLRQSVVELVRTWRQLQCALNDSPSLRNFDSAAPTAPTD